MQVTKRLFFPHPYLPVCIMGMETLNTLKKILLASSFARGNKSRARRLEERNRLPCGTSEPEKLLRRPSTPRLFFWIRRSTTVSFQVCLQVTLLIREHYWVLSSKDKKRDWFDNFRECFARLLPFVFAFWPCHFLFSSFPQKWSDWSLSSCYQWSA